MYEEFQVRKNYLKTGNREIQMSLIQGVAMTRLAFSSSQEANAMISLSNGWLKWSGEVNLQSSVFFLEVDEDGVYSYETGSGMVCI